MYKKYHVKLTRRQRNKLRRLSTRGRKERCQSLSYGFRSTKWYLNFCPRVLVLCFDLTPGRS
jgi:hypothetical protein